MYHWVLTIYCNNLKSKLSYTDSLFGLFPRGLFSQSTQTLHWTDIWFFLMDGPDFLPLSSVKPIQNSESTPCSSYTHVQLCKYVIACFHKCAILNVI